MRLRGGDADGGPDAEDTAAHQPPEGHGPGQLGHEDTPGAGAAGKRTAGGAGCELRCVSHTAGSTQLLHILPPEFLEGGMDAVVARLADPRQRERLARRIEDGSGFDDIAKLAGWDGIFLTSLHCPEDQPLFGQERGGGGGDRAQDAAGRLLRPADPGALPGDDDRLHGLGGGHRGHPPRPVQQSDLRRHLSHGGSAPSAGVRQLHPAAGALRPGDGDADVGAGRSQADGCAGGALRLQGKGLLAQGADADVCVFDPEKLHERGTYQQPRQTAEGMALVLVDGQVAVRDGQLTGAKAGRVIRR